MNPLNLSVLQSNATKFMIQRCVSSVCRTTCPTPLVVTLTGANSGSAQMVALLLKQSPLIDEIRLFDYDSGPCGHALDLSHIDTSCKIKAYTGLRTLKSAIDKAKIIAVCGGEATKAAHPEYELFKRNADFVHHIAMYAAEFNPEAVLCIATPPITAMVPLVSEEYKKAKVYDSRKIIGITALGVVRANSFIAAHAEKNPEGINCPIVGGMGHKTAVAVTSQTDIGALLTSPVADVLRNKIANAENHVLQMKYIENDGPCNVSTGFATARFILSCVRGLRDIFESFECGFVRQHGEAAEFLPYMGSVIKLGRHGIHTVHIPRMDNFECVHLQRAATVIREQISWGTAYVTGMSIKRKRRCKGVSTCPVLTSRESGIGDVIIDPGIEQVRRDGGLVPRYGSSL